MPNLFHRGAKLPYDHVAAVGLVLVAPALIFLFAMILKSTFGVSAFADVLDALIAPWPVIGDALISGLVLGGPVIAIAGTLLALSQCKDEKSNGNRVCAYTFRGTAANYGILAISLILVATFLIYLVAENSACWSGIRAAC